jgi:hypothetical protein
MLVGDTDSTDQQLTDEAIAFWLTANNDDVDSAAIECVRQLIARYSRQVNTWMGHTRVEANKRSEQYRLLLGDLQQKTGHRAEWFVGGVSIAGKESLAGDADAVQPAFAVGQDDYVEPAGVDEQGD